MYICRCTDVHNLSDFVLRETTYHAIEELMVGLSASERKRIRSKRTALMNRENYDRYCMRKVLALCLLEDGILSEEDKKKYIKGKKRRM